ncbi:MAG TPA: alpha/beta hydrolase [Allosphingosinicella sp.]|nr:alpha/beta hydrolase [Allosphingosinicella sp.]
MGAARFGPVRLARGVAMAAAALLLLLLLVLAGFRLAAALREDGAPAPPGTRMVPTPYGAVAVTVSGPASGRPVMLVHGTAAWGGFWKDVAEHLARRGWRVVAVDLPPFGWSEHDALARYDRITQAERLAAVLASTAGQPAVVVGHSFGAGPATELALRHGRRLRSLVLVDAALGELDSESGGDGGVLRFRPLAEAATSATITNPAAIGPLLRSMIERKARAAKWLPVLKAPMRRRGTTSAYAAWLPDLFAATDRALSRRSANLKRLAMPLALIWGEADTVTPIGQGVRIAALGRARSFATLPGVGHIPHIEDPKAFLAALDAAIAPDRGGAGK